MGWQPSFNCSWGEGITRAGILPVSQIICVATAQGCQCCVGQLNSLMCRSFDWSYSTLAAKVVRPENPQCPPCQGVTIPCTSHSFPWAHSTGLCGQACGYTNRVWRALSFHTEVSFQGESTVWDMQHYFTSCPTVRMLLKPVWWMCSQERAPWEHCLLLWLISVVLFRPIAWCKCIFSTEICEYHQVKILNSPVFPFPAPTRSDILFVSCRQGNADYVVYSF